MEEGSCLPDVFYKTCHLTLKQKRELLIKAKKICFDWWVDIQKDWTREKIEMTFEDVLLKLTEDCHFVFIHRKGYASWKFNRLETGFSTLKGKTYFLWVNVNEKKIPSFIKKYFLQIL